MAHRLPQQFFSAHLMLNPGSPTWSARHTGPTGPGSRPRYGGGNDQHHRHPMPSPMTNGESTRQRQLKHCFLYKEEDTAVQQAFEDCTT